MWESSAKARSLSSELKPYMTSMAERKERGVKEQYIESTGDEGVVRATRAFLFCSTSFSGNSSFVFNQH